MQNLSSRGHLQSRPHKVSTDKSLSLFHNLRLKTHEESKNQQTNSRIKPLRNFYMSEMSTDVDIIKTLREQDTMKKRTGRLE